MCHFEAGAGRSGGLIDGLRALPCAAAHGVGATEGIYEFTERRG